MTAERKYVMTKVRPGDYILPSNDGETLFRIASYEEDGSGYWVGYGGTREKQIVGTHWNGFRYNRPWDGDDAFDDEFLDWDRWDCVIQTQTSRKAVVNFLLDS